LTKTSLTRMKRPALKIASSWLSSSKVWSSPLTDVLMQRWLSQYSLFVRNYHLLCFSLQPGLLRRLYYVNSTLFYFPVICN
jgi:hypothetical protein